MSTNDGGPAFPHKDGTRQCPFCEKHIRGSHLGMTLRDWFAGQALAGMLAGEPIGIGRDGNAHEAYLCADAMLKERDK